LQNILCALREIAKDLPLVLPLHPRTRKKIEQLNNADSLSGIRIIEPLPYLEMQRLQMSAKVILTDSGGMQKEAYFNQVPCITLRNETEWIETVEVEANRLVGADVEQILSALLEVNRPITPDEDLYGDGNAAEKIISALLND
jgi:UDP-GlcNAc3NAcA epimerase